MLDQDRSRARIFALAAALAAASCHVLLPASSAAARTDGPTSYWFGPTTALPGETATLRLHADTVDPDGGQPAPDVHALEGLLHVDPAALQLVGLRVVAAGLAWETGFGELRAGSYDIGAANPQLPSLPSSAPMPDLDGEALLELDFVVLVPGSHWVAFQAHEIIPATPAQENPCCIVHSVGTIGGSIEAGSVGRAASSVGAWKSRPVPGP